MKVKQSSWHFKAWKWAQDPLKPPRTPSVCRYWSTIFIQIPFACILFIAIIPAIPLVWIAEKLEARFKGKSFCPFGKVEIEQ